jgi:hypothetical protein
MHVCVPRYDAAANTFAFDEFEVTPAQRACGTAPAGTPIVRTTAALAAPALVPLFGAARPVAPHHTCAWLYPARVCTRDGVVLDGGPDVAPATVSSSAGALDGEAAPRDVVVGLRGLAVFPYVREPLPAETLSCAAYVDDAGDGWAERPEFAALAQWMADHWGVLQPLLLVDTPAAYPLAVLRVVNDVPCDAELLAMFNGHDKLGRRSLSTPGTALKSREGAALLRCSSTSMRDVAALLAVQNDVVASGYRAVLTSDCDPTPRSAHTTATALAALRAALTGEAPHATLPGLLPTLRPPSIVQLPQLPEPHVLCSAAAKGAGMGTVMGTPVAAFRPHGSFADAYDGAAAAAAAGTFAAAAPPYAVGGGGGAGGTFAAGTFAAGTFDLGTFGTFHLGGGTFGTFPQNGTFVPSPAGALKTETPFP